MRTTRFLLLLSAVVLTTGVTAEEKFTRTELAKRGKPASALVLVEPGRTSGTAFVVHPDGLLVTSAHVVAAGTGSPNGRIRVALRPGQADQKVLDARVVRLDAELDVAVLKVDGEKGLPALALGDSDKLTELDELVGFGFPAGTVQFPDKPDLPAVSVSVNSVASLRKKDRVLSEVQFDGTLNLGHLGAPLLATDGTVRGVLRRPINGAQSIQATPANAIREFLATPELSVAPPKVDPSNPTRPIEFRADMISMVPSAEQPTLELILDVGDGSPRKVPMELRDGAYRATAAPVPTPATLTLTLTAKYGAATIVSPIPDRPITVGGKAMKLSEIRRLERGVPPRAVTHAGADFTGAIGGATVEVRVADQLVKLDLAKADAVELLPPPPPRQLTCTAVARVGGKEIARVGVSATLVVAAPPPVPPRSTMTPAALESVRVTRPLPEAFADVCAGGGGRFLLFSLPKAGRVALFDVSQAKIVHYFPAPDPDAKIAAGADKLVIALPGAGIIQRWNLTTFERELSVPFARQEPISSLLLGHSSRGPLVANGVYYDLGTLKPLDVKDVAGRPVTLASGKNVRAVASGDGTVIGSTQTNMSPGGLNTAVLNGAQVKTYQLHAGAGYVVPSADGKLVFTALGVHTFDLKAVHEPKNNVHFFPATQGSLYFGLRLAEPGRNGATTPVTDVSLYHPGDTRPLVLLGHFKENLLEGNDRNDASKRAWFVPDAKVFVTLPLTRDAVHLTKFDVDEALEKAGTDYLFDLSNPTATAKKGERYGHQLVVKSKRGGVKYKLDAGPPGMSVGPTGKIDWAVPAAFADKTAAVIVAVSDASGQEVYKTFTIGVEE
jgi:S1-C subfamily serine protease